MESKAPREPGLGDLRLFEQFVREHEADIYTYILRMVANREEAADLTQEAMLQTFRSWMRVDPEAEGGYIKWCYRIAHNLCVDAHRKKHPRTADEEELERAVEERALRPEAIYEGQAQSARIRAALLSLGEKYREALLLRFQSELSYEKIAEVLEVPVTTVETRIHRAKRMLREKLKRELE